MWQCGSDTRIPHFLVYQKDKKIQVREKMTEKVFNSLEKCDMIMRNVYVMILVGTVVLCPTFQIEDYPLPENYFRFRFYSFVILSFKNGGHHQYYYVVAGYPITF